ncbi:uroporphyrinogen-III C-methyltransferase [Niabella hibiscisoli]|uniref:uroporphyrinogen-III C-methyltransferase n=1 Tax=Niabella hibiscisoli TaxID=1825928 RepID=UPI001F0E3C70|nr:uroporphyrinogen-III C-methyltransferase [Niabella hibiscisoli]MCH5715410.1 uroporphyrinogen-III C-methyltransferase [Niabella hibiscisoli]
MILSHPTTSHLNPPQPGVGSVVLAAAGPGDPDLITVKAANALREAEVVLIDRLVSEVILHRYVSANVEIVRVGKECRNNISTPQQVINELIVDYALQGKRVVRLKGGDVSIFSNVLDELQVLIANKIPYEIIPGVTASLGAAAYAGIPLTARGYATSVRFLTYYKSDIVTDEHWQDLAKTNDTLVFYMSSGTLGNVVEKLQQFGVQKDVHVAVAEQATTCYQRIHECNIYDYDEVLAEKKFVSPSLVIIGKVVALHQQFKWLKNSEHEEQYFVPVGEGIQNINELNKPIKHVI